MKGDGLTLDAGRSAFVAFRLHEMRLRQGLYTVGLWMGILNDSDIDVVQSATSFRMEARMEDIRYTTPFPEHTSAIFGTPFARSRCRARNRR